MNQFNYRFPSKVKYTIILQSTKSLQHFHYHLRALLNINIFTGLNKKLKLTIILYKTINLNLEFQQF